MRTIPVIGDEVILYGYIDRENENRVHVCAKLPNEDWNGARLNVIDWKIDGEVVMVRYQTRDDAYAPIFDSQFPVVKEIFKLSKPNKSKNWKLDPYEDLWRNKKTGQKVYI